MEYQITHLILRIIPNEPVNRETFFKSIIAALGLQEHKFANSGGGKYFFSAAEYKGIKINLPFYEQIDKLGFFVHISKRGFETLKKSHDSISSFLNTFFDTFSLISCIRCTRLDVETDYISPAVSELVSHHLSESPIKAFIGLRNSTVHAFYDCDTVIYTIHNSKADELLNLYICGSPDCFSNSLNSFLNNWKPLHYKISCCLPEIKQEPRPHSSTK